MKRFNLILIILVLIFACNRNKNESLILDLNRFVSDVELNFKYYSENDWLKKDEEFAKLSEIEFQNLKNKMTSEEVSRTNEIIGKYKAIKFKKSFNDVRSEIKDVFGESKGFIKEIMPDSSEIKDAIKKGKDEIKALISDSLR